MIDNNEFIEMMMNHIGHTRLYIRSKILIFDMDQQVEIFMTMTFTNYAIHIEMLSFNVVYDYTLCTITHSEHVSHLRV